MGALQVTIDHLGGLGDGVAVTAEGRLHVPLTAPGDVAIVAPRGKDKTELVAILTPGAARTDPPCRHFGLCGGCALQHLDRAFIAGWKRARVEATLIRAGITGASIAPTVSIAPRTRRRATLAAARIGKRVVLGFTERASHRLVDIAECWVLRPELVAILGPLRERLAGLLTNGETADISVTLSANGIDLLLIRERAPTLADRESLASLAEELDLARVAWKSRPNRDAEPIATRRTPTIRMGGYAAGIAPGGFLQPSDEGQAALVERVTEAIRGANGPFCDLFCGVGAFALAASAFGPVAAYDGDLAAIGALRTLRAHGVTAHHRDLFREPLTAKELAPFQAVILDPPRAGAQAQARMLAGSHAPLIAYVSCNPASFARDAAILEGGGYRLTEVTSVDQFLWSPHIELVGVFKR